jgi:predicted HD superfamily hydrolase involved in NAD metabolism
MTNKKQRKEVLTWLKDHVPPSRIEHILGVEEMAIDLAKHYQLDEEKAAHAGLMHDLAKYFKPKKLLEMAQEQRQILEPVEIANPHLLHAEISAIVAKNEFGVEDQEILDAIANHTLGKPEMSTLSTIIYLADTLELGRGDSAELKKLRELSKENLYKALWKTCDYSLKYLLETRCLIHPRTILTRNWAMQKVAQGSGKE